MLTCRPFDGHYQSQQRSLTTVTLHWPALVFLRSQPLSAKGVVTLQWVEAGKEAVGIKIETTEVAKTRLDMIIQTSLDLSVKQWYQFLSILNKSLLVLAK